MNYKGVYLVCVTLSFYGQWEFGSFFEGLDYVFRVVFFFIFQDQFGLLVWFMVIFSIYSFYFIFCCWFLVSLAFLGLQQEYRGRRGGFVSSFTRFFEVLQVVGEFEFYCFYQKLFICFCCLIYFLLVFWFYFKYFWVLNIFFNIVVIGKDKCLKQIDKFEKNNVVG